MSDLIDRVDFVTPNGTLSAGYSRLAFGGNPDSSFDITEFTGIDRVNEDRPSLSIRLGNALRELGAVDAVVWKSHGSVRVNQRGDLALNNEPVAGQRDKVRAYPRGLTNPDGALAAVLAATLLVSQELAAEGTGGDSTQ